MAYPIVLRAFGPTEWGREQRYLAYKQDGNMSITIENIVH